jgi:hypothetical protein
MDTVTYASAAMLPFTVAQAQTRPARSEVEFVRLDFSLIKP